jgi:O-methyltransferase involved in polyketide biosynthesis
MIVMEGLVMYITAEEGEDLVERVVRRFPSGQLGFDAVGSLMIAMQSWVPMVKATGAVERWGLDSPKALERLDPRLKLRDVIRFSQQEGADELGFPVWYVAWILSNTPYLKNIGYTLRYDF